MVSLTDYYGDQSTEAHVAILGSIDVDPDMITLDWGLGDGSSKHSELLSAMLGKRTGDSVIHHELTLGSSTLLHLGAFGYTDSSKRELDLTFLGGCYSVVDESLKVPTEPSPKDRRVIGRIVLASSIAFMEEGGYTSCNLGFKFETGGQYRNPFAYGTLIQQR